MVTYLNKVKDYKIINYQIKALNEEIKDPKKDQLVFHIGANENDIYEFINSNIFYVNNFRSFFTEKLMVSENKKIRKMIKLNDRYKELLEKTNYKLICRNNITAYKNTNVFFDLTPEININMLSTKSSRLVKQRMFFDVIFKKLTSYNYKEKIVVFNIDNMDIENKDSFLNYFINAVSKKQTYLIDYFKDITFIFLSSSKKYYFKVVITEEIFKKKAILISRLNALKDVTPLEDEIEKDSEKKNKPINSFQRKLENISNETEEKENKKNNIKEKVKKDLGIKDEGRDEDSEFIDEINSDIDNTVDDLDENNQLEDLTEEDLMKILSDKKEFKQSLIQAQNNQLNGHQKLNAEQLKREQEKLSFMDVSLKEIEENYKAKSIEENIITNNITDVVNKEILHSTLKNYDEIYMAKKFNKDIANILKSFNDDKDLGVYVKDIKLTTNNTDMNKQSLLEVEFKDDTNVSHKFKINIPEVKDGRFMFVNGTKKVIMKQITFKPIVKLEPDRVQITTNYNKHFVNRFGQRFSEKLDYLKKLFTKHNISSIKKPGCKFEFKFGNSLKDNGKYITSAEYSDISSYIYSLNISNYEFTFNQQYIQNLFDPTKNEYNEKLALKANYDKKYYFCMGCTTDKKQLILTNIMDKKVYLYDGKNYNCLEITLSSLIINLINENTIPEKLSKLASVKVKTNTKLTYSRIEINNKKIPLAILLSYELGLLNLLERYEINYEFDTKNKSINLQDDIGKIKFKDGYLYFDTSKIRNTILLSGLLEMNCEDIVFADMNEQDPYLDYFQDAFNSRNAAKGFHNTLTLLIDPITKDILEELNQPTNVYDVLLYANTLLEDLSFTEPSDVNNFRIRGAEQIPAMLYKIYADAFKHYKDSKHAKNPVKISVDPDILTKKLMELKTIESYSSLNPSLELERLGTASMKG